MLLSYEENMQEDDSKNIYDIIKIYQISLMMMRF